MSSPAEGAVSGGSNSGGATNKIVLALTVVNLLGTLGMLGVLVTSFQKEKKKQSIEDISAHSGEEKKEGEGHGEGHGEEGKEPAKKSVTFGRMVTLEQFTVNLSAPGSVSAKYVRVNISLEVSNEDVEAEINSKIPQVRNAVIDLFNSKRPSDLAAVEGREYLKDEVKNALNAFLVSGKVKGVYFTSFALAG